MKSYTAADVLALPVAVDLATAGAVLGVGRTKAHELNRRNEFPVPVLRIGNRYRVTRASLLGLLGIPENSEAGAPTAPATATTDPADKELTLAHDDARQSLTTTPPPFGFGAGLRAAS